VNQFVRAGYTHTKRCLGAKYRLCGGYNHNSNSILLRFDSRYTAVRLRL